VHTPDGYLGPQTCGGMYVPVPDGTTAQAYPHPHRSGHH
jgi:hypothetical protein